MRQKLLFALLLSFAVTAICEQKPVIEPRAKAQDYPAVQDRPTVTIGAALLSKSQARKALVSNLRNDYLLVEVGIYPKGEVRVSPRDFSLRAKGQTQKIAPADPEKMAYEINNKDQQGHDVAIRPVTSIEYSTGGGREDPYYDRGLTVSNGVMVDVDNRKKSPAASSGDRKAMTAELKEKGLPEAAVKSPVAGYVYFPVSVSPGTSYELIYQGPSGPVVIALPAPGK